MIGIIGAMEIEVENVKAFLTDIKHEKISGVDFVSGKYKNTDVVVAKCGVGKVFAALCAEAMIMRYSPKIIINTGVAGALADGLKIGDIVIADAVVQHDMDTSALGDPPGMISGIDIIDIPADKEVVSLLEKSVDALKLNHVTGKIASGDRFVADDNTKKYIKNNFSAVSCEMEGAAIGHVCYVNNVSFGVLRAMSDEANGDAQVDFPSFVKTAAENSTNVIKGFLSLIQE